MATRAIQHAQLAEPGPTPFMRGSGSTRARTGTTRANRSIRPSVSVCPRSVDLVGRPVALSADVPVLFDGPLTSHHKLIGAWVAARGEQSKAYTRVEARQHIERVFDTSVRTVLDIVDMVEFRTVVAHGPEGEPPAIVLACDTIGQIDLGWIETSDAPIAWRAAAYQALELTLGAALPIFGYSDLFEVISSLYWDGETEDDAARQALIEYYGTDHVEVESLPSPSQLQARRPAWMIAANAAAPKQLPTALRKALYQLKDAHRRLRRLPGEAHAWSFDTNTLYEYLPGIEECSTLPPLTLVPVEQFACEVDDVGRHGMETGFMDVIGLCPLVDAHQIDAWFTSLRTGTAFLAAAQALIGLDPDNLSRPS